MLLIQTAFAPEYQAVCAAGVRRAAAGHGAVKIAGRNCVVLMTGIGLKAARRNLAAGLDRIERPEAVLSIGLAGGLDPQWQFGQRLLIDSVLTLDASNDRIVSDLERFLPNRRTQTSVGTLVSLEQPALTSQVKRHLFEQSQAAACDMETYAVADVCRQRQIPWLGARVISDAAHEEIPAWITTLPYLIEQKKWLRLLGRVATHPQDLPRLIRLALCMQKLKPILTQWTSDLVQHVLST